MWCFLFYINTRHNQTTKHHQTQENDHSNTQHRHMYNTTQDQKSLNGGHFFKNYKHNKNKQKKKIDCKSSQ